MNENHTTSLSNCIHRPWYIIVISVFFIGSFISVMVGFVFWDLTLKPENIENLFHGAANINLENILFAIILLGLSSALFWGLWTLRKWAQTILSVFLTLGIVYLLVTVLFDVSAQLFAGEELLSLSEIFTILIHALLKIIYSCLIPVAMLYGLRVGGSYFRENINEKKIVDRGVRYILLVTALSAIFIVFLIIVFTMIESWDAVENIGLDNMLLGMVWRPGSIIGNNEAQFGLVPMIVGSILSTLGAALIGIPLSIGAAILLSEVAPDSVRGIVRPAVELLAGIPSVIYGLFGMVVLAPLIREIPVPRNLGFGLLNASIILAVMIIPTITNIAEDAIRAVPKSYKQGSLALGATHWQAIAGVILPAARSGIIASIILGIGRALGETMAVIMIIGNSIAMPKPVVEGNPLSIIFSTARTLTGNIAVEINYAEGVHRSALFFTGIMLFIMIFIVNNIARYLMRERLPSS